MRILGALAACSNGIASRSPIPVLTTVRICVADSKLVRPEIENLKRDRCYCLLPFQFTYTQPKSFCWNILFTKIIAII